MKVKYSIELQGGEQDGLKHKGESDVAIILAGNLADDGELATEHVMAVGPLSMGHIVKMTMGFVESWENANAEFGIDLQKLFCVALLTMMKEKIDRRGGDNKIFGTDFSLGVIVDNMRKAGWSGGK
jgi:hypothetical protein